MHLTYTASWLINSGTILTNKNYKCGTESISSEYFKERMTSIYGNKVDEQRIFEKVLYQITDLFNHPNIEIVVRINQIIVSFKKQVPSWIPFLKTWEIVKQININYGSVDWTGSFFLQSEVCSWELRYYRRGKKDIHARKVRSLSSKGEICVPFSKLNYDRLSLEDKSKVESVSKVIQRCSTISNSIDFIVEN